MGRTQGQGGSTHQVGEGTEGRGDWQLGSTLRLSTCALKHLATGTLRIASQPPLPPPLCRRTPLAAGMFSNVLHLGLLLVLVFGLGWGVAGAGLATSISHWAGLAFLLATVLSRGYMR